MGEMKKVQCLNGHFFDRNRFEICPLCDAAQKEERTATIIDLRSESDDKFLKEKKEKSSFFRFIRPNRNVDEINKSDNPTRGLDGNSQQVVNDSIIEINKEDSMEQLEEVNIPETSTSIETESAKIEIVSEVIQEKSIEKIPSLVYQVNENATTIDEKTRGRYTTETAEPVVGWLVCIQGESQGESFKLYDGKNSIGRMRTNKVCLADENSVSREKHAIVIFDAKNTAFYLQPGDGDKITYLNDSPVFVPQQLKEFDKIQLGDCELLFIPLCSERFKWEDYMK